MKWYAYIVKCRDNTFYTGLTNNLDRRIFEHNYDNVRGSKYIRVRRPVKLVYNEVFSSKTDAQKRENSIKNWTRINKIKLINSNNVGFTP